MFTRGRYEGNVNLSVPLIVTVTVLIVLLCGVLLVDLFQQRENAQDMRAYRIHSLLAVLMRATESTQVTADITPAYWDMSNAPKPSTDTFWKASRGLIVEHDRAQMDETFLSDETKVLWNPVRGNQQHALLTTVPGSGLDDAVTADGIDPYKILLAASLDAPQGNYPGTYYIIGALLAVVVVLGGGWIYYLLRQCKELKAQLAESFLRQGGSNSLQHNNPAWNTSGSQPAHQNDASSFTIAQEIHDDLGQKLVALRMDIAMLAQHREKTSPVVLSEALSNLKSQVDGVIQSMRAIVRNQMPAELDAGLIPAIQALVDEFGETFHLSIDFKCSLPEEVTFDKPLAATVFRIVQESFTNIVRHAHATHVFLELISEDKKFRISVKDNGVGFSLDEKELGFGLKSMKERAAIHDGEITIASALGGGVCISALFPLDVKRKSLSTTYGALA